MIQNLEKIILMLNNVISLTEKANLSHKNKGEIYPSDVSSIEQLAYTQEDIALDEYFKKLDYSDIQIIQAIMYIGRDGKNYFVKEGTPVTSEELLNKAIESFKNLHPNKDVAIHHITKKATLGKYLRKGAEILNIQIS